MSADAARAHHRSTELGITLHASHQSRGYGSEAILWAAEFAFRHANLHRVAIGAFAWNERAYGLYERLGFVMEGRARECFWYDGRWEDAVSLGMLAGEWWERYGNEKRKGEQRSLA
jgi:RimJ/RimL family protein N-acetyltransferase